MLSDLLLSSPIVSGSGGGGGGAGKTTQPQLFVTQSPLTLCGLQQAVLATWMSLVSIPTLTLSFTWSRALVLRCSDRNPLLQAMQLSMEEARRSEEEAAKQSAAAATTET